MQATQTQKEVIDGLGKVVNSFGGAKIHVSIADHIKRAGAAIGLRIRSEFYNPADCTIMMYVD